MYSSLLGRDIVWKMWQLLPGSRTLPRQGNPSDSILSPPFLSPGETFQEAVEKATEDEGEKGEDQGGPSGVPLPSATATPPKEEDKTKSAEERPGRPRVPMWNPDLRRDTYLDLPGTYDRKKGIGRRAFRFKKVAVRICKTTL